MTTSTPYPLRQAPRWVPVKPRAGGAGKDTAPQTPSEAPPQSVEHRLAACQGYIRAAAWHCFSRHQPAREIDYDDMAQEANIAIWRELERDPTIPIGYIWQVAYTAALHVLRSGRSVDCFRVDRRFNYQVFSLESLSENKESWDTVEDALARHKRRGEVPDPTKDVAVTRVMLQELWQRLTPRQRQVLDLRLQQYSESEAGAVLGISQVSVSKLVIAIKLKATAAWGDKPQPPPRVKLTPEQVKERIRERDRQRAKIPQRKEAMKAYRAQHREAVNARRRARRRERREQFNAKKELYPCVICGKLTNHLYCSNACQCKKYRAQRREAVNARRPDSIRQEAEKYV